jgi:hypothetical protein
VVDVLKRHYAELERLSQATPEITAKLSTEVRIDKGLEPAPDIKARRRARPGQRKRLSGLDRRGPAGSAVAV